MRENFSKFSYLDYLGEKTLANSLFQINTEIKGSVKLREKILAIGHQFANVFSRQCFPLYGNLQFIFCSLNTYIS